MDNIGLLLASRYAASPNTFGYCGPNENASIINHLHEGVADRELAHHLTEFETFYPYLLFIARENKIADPFDRRVVEAYWIGNSLLERCSSNNYLAFLTEKLAGEKKLGHTLFTTLKQKVLSLPFLPHHAYHVFNIFRRMGRDASIHTLATMDNCRIGWGTVIKGKGKGTVDVATQPLRLHAGSLALGKTIIRTVDTVYKRKTLGQIPAKGSLLTYHWGKFCDAVTGEQVKNLCFYTQKAIDYYNAS